MKKTLFYTYLGVNGTLTTPVELPDIYKVKSYSLVADDGYLLTDDDVNFVESVSKVSEANLQYWKEVPNPNK